MPWAVTITEESVTETANCQSYRQLSETWGCANAKPPR